MEKEIVEYGMNINRRHFLSRLSLGIGSVALGSLLIPDLFRGGDNEVDNIFQRLPHFAPRAKRVIYLFQAGGVSQLESFDYKPKLAEMFGQELPDSIRQGQRLTGMTASQSSFPLAASVFNFQQYGRAGAWVSELFPHHARTVDEICMI